MLHPQMAPNSQCRDEEATQLHLGPQGPREPSQGVFLAREGADGDQEQPGWATGSIAPSHIASPMSDSSRTQERRDVP